MLPQWNQQRVRYHALLPSGYDDLSPNKNHAKRKMIPNEKDIIIANLNISPRGPRDCTIEDILATHRNSKVPELVTDDDHTEGDLVTQQSLADISDDMHQQEFTRVKGKKKKGKKL